LTAWSHPCYSLRRKNAERSKLASICEKLLLKSAAAGERNVKIVSVRTLNIFKPVMFADSHRKACVFRNYDKASVNNIKEKRVHV